MAETFLHKAYGKVMSLEPIDPNASPTKKERFAEEAIKYNQLIGLMHCHLTGILTASGIDDGNSGEWQDPDMPIDEPSVITPASRVQEIDDLLDSGGSQCLDVDEWLALIIYSPKMTMYTAEQKGFVRLFCGYRAARSINALASHKHLKKVCRDPDDNDGVYDRSISIEAIADPVVRLHERETILLAIDTTDTLRAFINGVLRAIHALRFAFEWAELSTASKAQFRSEAFNSFNADFVSKTHTQAEYKRKFTAFKNRHERVIKARNDLKTLFLKFHSAILMDPICWAPTASYLSTTTGRSPTFSATMALLLQNTVPLDADVAAENERAFTQLISLLMGEGGEHVKYILGFLAAYPAVVTL